MFNIYGHASRVCNVLPAIFVVQTRPTLHIDVCIPVQTVQATALNVMVTSSLRYKN